MMRFSLESKTNFRKAYLYFKGLNEFEPGLYLPGPGPSSGDLVLNFTPKGIFGPSPYFQFSLQSRFFLGMLLVLVSTFILYLHFVFIRVDCLKSTYVHFGLFAIVTENYRLSFS